MRLSPSSSYSDLLSSSLFPLLESAGSLGWALVDRCGHFQTPPQQLTCVLGSCKEPQNLLDLLPSSQQSFVAATIANVLDSGTPQSHRLPLAIPTEEGSRQGEGEMIFGAGGPLEPPTTSSPALILLIPNLPHEGLTAEGLQNHKLVNVGALSAGVSHDLNNLFTGMSAFTHLLRSEIHDPKLLRYLTTIEETLEKSSRLTESVTDFLKEEKEQSTPGYPVQTLRDILYLVQRTLNPKIRLQILLPGEDYPVNARRSELSQLFLNLLINARDAITNDGVIGVQAQFNPESDPDKFFLRIEDSGVGIPEDKEKFIFDPFYTTKGAQGGTGLGLSVVQSIIHRAGGSISCSPNTPQGTVFQVTLPTVK